MTRMWAFFAAWLLALASPAQGQVRHILDLDPQVQQAQMLDWGDYRIDEGGRLTLQGFLAPGPPLQPTRVPSVYPLKDGEALWIRFSAPAAPDDQRWYLKIAQPGLNLVTLHTRRPDGVWTPEASGDSLPVSAWALPHLYPVLPLSVSAEEPTLYALRVVASDGLRAPLEFVTASRLSAEQQRMSLLYGVYFGLLAMSAIFALATSVVLRDAAYLAFGLWALAATAATATAVGVTGLHLWPDHPEWGDAAPYALPALSMSALLIFVAEALSVRERAAKVYGVILVLVTAGLAMAYQLHTMSGTARLEALLATLAVLWLAAVATMAWAWWRGDRFGRRLLLAFVPMPVALLMQGPGTLPQAWPAWMSGDGLILLALGVAVPLGYLLLSLRSQERRDHKRRIAQLSDIDPTTGLVNDVVFLRRMGRLIERSVRFDQPGVVALLDIPNLTPLRAEFGRKRALELLLRLAERLSSMVRNVDTVARVGDARFGLLLEGSLEPSRARAFGTKLIAHCIAPVPGLPQGMRARPKVVVGLVPQHGDTPQAVMQALERALEDLLNDPERSMYMLEATRSTLPPVRDDTEQVAATNLQDWDSTARLDREDSR